MGNGKGAEKKQMVLDIAKVILERFKGPGVGLPGDDELSDLIEQAVAQLNKSKELVGEATQLVGGIDVALAQTGRDCIVIGVKMLSQAGVTK